MPIQGVECSWTDAIDLKVSSSMEKYVKLEKFDYVY